MVRLEYERLLNKGKSRKVTILLWKGVRNIIKKKKEEKTLDYMCYQVTEERTVG